MEQTCTMKWLSLTHRRNNSDIIQCQEHQGLMEDDQTVGHSSTAAWATCPLWKGMLKWKSLGENLELKLNQKLIN